MPSRRVASPAFCPDRRPGKRWGALLMLSIPPATITSASPSMICCAASATAMRPLPQTLLMVAAGTWSGRPACSIAWRAGAIPSPACRTLPMYTPSTESGSMRARSTAPRMAIPPSCGAVNEERAPRNRPIGVRTALTMTACWRCDWRLVMIVPPSYRGRFGLQWSLRQLVTLSALGE